MEVATVVDAVASPQGTTPGEDGAPVWWTSEDDATAELLRQGLDLRAVRAFEDT